MESLETQVETQNLEDESTLDEESRDSDLSGWKAILNHSEGSGEGAKESGERVSLNVDAGVDGVVEKSREDETEISVRNGGVGCIGGDVSVDAVEGSSLVDVVAADETQMLEFPHKNGNNAVVSEDSVINENEKNEVAKASVSEGMKEDGGSMSNGDNLAKKIEVLGFNEDGKSVVGNASVDGEMKKDGAFKLNGSDSTRKIEFSGNDISLVVEVYGSSAGVVQDIGSEEGGRSNVGQISEEGTKNGALEDEEEEMEEDNNIDDQGHEFAVGDFVWGKVKSRPWWPGQIYDPSDASKDAAKYHRRDRLLVAFFGDGTFAWCYPFQLKPFQENFDRMLKQNNSTSFLNAVKKALGEIRRQLEVEMACSCIPTETRATLVRPLTLNSGIKEGVAVPESWVSELSVTRYEPSEILTRLRYIAQDVSVTDMFDLTVLWSWLSSFYCAKGSNRLPLFYEPEGITDTEDNAENVIPRKDDFYGQTENSTLSLPEKDWVSIPIRPEFGENLAEKWPGILEDTLYQKKKKRSMTELLASASRKRKKKKGFDVGMYGGLAEDGSGGSKSSSLSRKRKKIKLSESPSSIAENKYLSDKNNDIGAEDGSKTSTLSRERKKSKYLSPPYTSLSRGIKSLISLEDSETESPKVSRDPKKPSKGLHSMSGRLSRRMPKEFKKKTALEGGSLSVEKLLSEFQFAVLDAMYLKEHEYSETIKDFFTKFRSSCYGTGSDYKLSNTNVASRHGGKRKSLDTKPGLPSKGTHETCDRTPDGESGQKNRKRKEEATFQSPESNLELVIGSANVKTVHKGEANGEERGKRKKEGNHKEEANGEKDGHKNDHPTSECVSKPKKRNWKREAKMSVESKLGLASGITFGEKDGHMNEHPTSAGVSKPKKRNWKSEAKNLGPERKLEFVAGTKMELVACMNQHPTSEGVSKPKKRKWKTEAKSLGPESKLELVAGTANGEKDGHKNDNPVSEILSNKPKKRKWKREAMGMGPENKLEGKKDGHKNDHSLSEGTSKPKKRKSKREAIMKANHHAEANGETSAAALVLTFAPGVPLPSKEDLVAIFGRFGALNEFETEILKDSSCARVAYKRSSDAEEAFNSSEKNSPFGPATVSYRLQYHDEMSLQCLPKPLQMERGNTQAPPLIFIKQNLEMMTSMLESSGDALSPVEKSNLEGGIKGLLKKVTTMVDAPLRLNL